MEALRGKMRSISLVGENLNFSILNEKNALPELKFRALSSMVDLYKTLSKAKSLKHAEEESEI